MYEKTLSNWKYIVSVDEDNRSLFDVIPDKKIEKPKTLYKYFPLTDNAVNGLCHNYLYASHPDQFNDLYDCFHELIDSNRSEKYFHELLSNYFSAEIIRERCSSNPKAFNVSVALWLRAIIYRFYGLVSMTESNLDVLMWSLYSDNKGFAVEFDYTVFPFQFHGPYPMNYSPHFEKIAIQNDLERGLYLLYMSTIKNEVWRYENEWRLIIDAPKEQQMFSPKIQKLKELGGHDRKFSYPLKAIESISLGNHFFEIEELNGRDKQKLEINLKENIEKKRSVLDFISANEIPSKIITRKSHELRFDLDFRDGFFHKTGNNQYKFIAFD
ncbi:DUF2971 domain-containing protein [Mangrovibacterium marinum]|uniref:DUF2971 domain-containing protein n=1 Tax=Mangrovibacterium marinum TaxID=1639118 RepID=UPI002A18B2CF|nr:DUF2971 domain-containing protein [Mangrovibacterium marinum]